MKRFEITCDDTRRRVNAYIDGLGYERVDDELEAKRETVSRVLASVREHGDAALVEYTEKFDGLHLRPDEFEVDTATLDAAVAGLKPALRSILERAQENIRHFHERCLRSSWSETYEDGTTLGQRITPLARVGVYVPGGKAYYPSSVLMNIVPAKVAGVPEIIMVSPPSFDGGIHPVVLAAARIAGVTRVFKIGGAQAVAALAYGTATVPQVMKITGPGNFYVAVAKSMVRGQVEIDSEAGPSEVTVLADAAANPLHVAAELVCQAEHDEEAVAILVTPSASLADAVVKLAAEEAARLPRRSIIEQALASRGAIFVTRGLDEAIEITNLIAPEHLSVQTQHARDVADRIENAGAIMCGAMTPVAVGDYYAGPNHILPTGRRARFQSPLTAEDFRKVTSFLSYSRERLMAQADDIKTFAQVEQLQAHARAIEVRQ